MVENNLYLVLVSGEIKGVGYWLVDTTFAENPLQENKELLECHRKELIGEESAKQIICAIKLNIKNLINDLEKDGYFLEKPIKGISYSFPLNEIEKIFDFWLETFRNKEEWEACVGLLKIKQRVSLRRIMNEGIKENLRKWAIIIEDLHKYRPSTIRKNVHNEPMWK